MSDLREKAEALLPVWCAACGTKLNTWLEIRDHWNNFPAHYAEVLISEPKRAELASPEVQTTAEALMEMKTERVNKKPEAKLPFELPLSVNGSTGEYRIYDATGTVLAIGPSWMLNALISLANRAEQSEAGRELAITAISRITGDDFCEDLDCQSAFHPENMSGLEKACHEKLSLIYRIAHSHDTSASCYDKHENWRKLAAEVLKGGEL